MINPRDLKRLLNQMFFHFLKNLMVAKYTPQMSFYSVCKNYLNHVFRSGNKYPFFKVQYSCSCHWRGLQWHLRFTVYILPRLLLEGYFGIVSIQLKIQQTQKHQCFEITLFALLWFQNLQIYFACFSELEMLKFASKYLHILFPVQWKGGQS